MLFFLTASFICDTVRSSLAMSIILCVVQCQKKKKSAALPRKFSFKFKHSSSDCVCYSNNVNTPLCFCSPWIFKSQLSYVHKQWLCWKATRWDCNTCIMNQNQYAFFFFFDIQAPCFILKEELLHIVGALWRPPKPELLPKFAAVASAASFTSINCPT